jgi:phosphotriesterase-related protein
MDRFGLDPFLPFAERVNTVVELVRRGYAERVVISQDASCFIDFFDPAAKRNLVSNWNYHHISDDVLPALLDAGVTEDEIDTILVKNPRRYLE